MEENPHQEVGAEVGDGCECRGRTPDSEWKDLAHNQPADWAEADLHIAREDTAPGVPLEATEHFTRFYNPRQKASLNAEQLVMNC
jgi:hypothetical protein